MKLPRNVLTVIAMIVVVVIGTAASFPPQPTFSNLKVLPQNISEHALDSFMNAYNKALKVSCDFCHSKAASLLSLPGAQVELDFAKDNAMKEEARDMMRMTMDLNQRYFRHDSTRNPLYLNVVTCNTCHRGNAYPAHE